MGWNPGEGGGGGAVDSVFGRSGIVTAQSGDYASSQITDATFGDVQVMGEQLDALALTVDTKLDADSGTLTDGTLAGTTTAAAASTVALAAASSVTVPTAAPGDSDTSAASTAFVTDAIAVVTGGSAAIAPAYQLAAGSGPTISGTGLVTYITATTPSLPAGTYQVEWSVVATHTSTGSSQGVQTTIGATQVPTATIDGYAAPGAGSRTQVNARGTYVHGATGTLAVLVQVRRAAGSGNVIPQAGLVTLRRIA